MGVIGRAFLHNVQSPTYNGIVYTVDPRIPRGKRRCEYGRSHKDLSSASQEECQRMKKRGDNNCGQDWQEREPHALISTGLVLSKAMCPPCILS